MSEKMPQIKKQPVESEKKLTKKDLAESARLLLAKKHKAPNHELTPAEETKLAAIHEYLAGAEVEEEPQIKQTTEKEVKIPWYQKMWRGLVNVNETMKEKESSFMELLNYEPSQNLADSFINIYRRKKALKEMKKRGFESFADFRLLDIEIKSIQKKPYGEMISSFEKNLDRGYYDLYGRKEKERADIEKIEGELVIDGPLFGAKPVTMEWKAYVYQTKEEARERDYSIELYWHQNINRVVSGSWADIEVPEIVQNQGDKIGLDTYVSAHVPEYNIYYQPHHKGEAAHARIPVGVATRMDKLYYIQVTRQVFEHLKKYVKQHCFTDEAINPEYIDTKFQVNTEISQQIEAEREHEIINGLQNRRFDEKIFYYGQGARKFLEILKSPEYQLGNIELQLIEQNLAALDPYLQNRTIIDLGAANALKVIPLLNEQLKTKKQVEYVPIDINPAMIFAASANINNPQVEVKGLILDFEKPLAGKLKPGNKFLTLLGSTLGNGDANWQRNTLHNIGQAMSEEDCLLVGVHLKTDLQKTLKMYENPKGREFVLATVESLGFPKDKVELSFVPDETARQIKVIIKVKENLNVRGIEFKQGENLTIFVSQKYNIGELGQLAQSADLAVVRSFMDEQNQYELAVLKKK